MIYNRFALIFCAVFILSNCSQDKEVIKGHAHNDYENETPLLDAIKNGFTSVEVDVHLIENELYVSHDLPHQLNADSTLEALYLNPLKHHLVKNDKAIYRNYNGPFYLMIDFKSPAIPTYEKLKEILSEYLPIISITQNGIKQKGPVDVFISGNRPINIILADEPKLVGIDGKPDDLDKNIPSSIMPIVSDKYSNVLSWTGEGEISLDDMNNLTTLLQNTHAQNKKLRLWAAPDNEIVWKLLLDNGVDLINTDRLKEFRVFALKYNAIN
jgi:glycerophosphoryl diester phosphodiesterase